MLARICVFALCLSLLLGATAFAGGAAGGHWLVDAAFLAAAGTFVGAGVLLAADRARTLAADHEAARRGTSSDGGAAAGPTRTRPPARREHAASGRVRHDLASPGASSRAEAAGADPAITTGSASPRT